MKKVIFVTQSKGGAGKSILSYLLAEKYPQAGIFDMDDATKTTSLQLAYRNPRQFTFLNTNNIIDRGAFDGFLDRITSTDRELFIADLGASVSEQLPFYLHDVADFLPRVLEELGIELELYAVAGGANIFVQTMGYIDELVKAAQGRYRISLLRNDFYDFTEEQTQLLEQFAQTHSLPTVPFNISKVKSMSTHARLNDVLVAGQGIQQAGILTRAYFQQAINQLTV